MESSGNKLWRIIVWASVTKMLFAQSNENNATTGCYTGPSTIDSNTIFSTGKQYVSSAGIECSGFITAWNFCHYVIGFRDQETELWAGAWRIENSVYNFVGLNVMVFGPAGQGGQFRCLEYPVDPADWIEVSEGDYIGFFVPENGVFLGSASAQSDPGHMQLQRSEYGYVENFNVSDLEEDTATFGRALLGANIGKHVITNIPIECKLKSFSWPIQSAELLQWLSRRFRISVKNFICSSSAAKLR